MEVGIVGAGAVAKGYAAFLSIQGHSPKIWSPSGGRTSGFLEGRSLKAIGAVEFEFRPHVCKDARDLAQNDVIVLALPAYGHRNVVDQLVPHLEPGHSVIISGHLSFGALYLAKRLAQRGMEIPIAAWGTTVLTAKSPSDYVVRVGAVRKRVAMAALPVRNADRAQAICSDLFGDRFEVKDDLLTITLSNLNPQNHMAIALCNLTRIELGETWGQNSSLTPSVGRLLEALDRERLQIAGGLGRSVGTIFDFFSGSFGVTDDKVFGIAEVLVTQGYDPVGPNDISTRYVLEDVPFGLVPILHLANLCGIAAPLHASGVGILSACYGRDLATENNLLPELAEVDLETLKRLVGDGYSLPQRQ